MRTSILIPAYDQLAFTKRCLDAVAATAPLDRCEVVVVDNGSTDATPAYLASLAGRVSWLKVVTIAENAGFVGANNVGARACGGDAIVFLNNDTEPRAGWLEALLAPLERDPAIGAVGAKLVYPDGRLQEAGSIVFADGSGWNYGKLADPADPRFGFVRDVDYCSAACLAVRADLFRAIGGFDERFAPAYYEDTDLCFEVRRRGFRVVYQPAAEVVHHEGATNGTDLEAGLKRHQTLNRGVFREKWAAELERRSPHEPSLVRRASDLAPGKRILVVDPFPPAYDRASGSRRLFELLRILAAAGHAVTFLARNGFGGERYARELAQLGVESYMGDVLMMGRLGFEASGPPLDLPTLLQETGYDLALLSFWEIAEDYLPLLRRFSPHTAVVVDSVDLHYLREAREAELLGEADAPTREARRRRELAAYAAAEAVVVVTEEERRRLLEELPAADVHVIPNVHVPAAEAAPLEERDGILFVGNFRHPPNADAVRWFHDEVLPLVRAELPQVRVTVVGADPPPGVTALAGDGFAVTGHVPAVEPYLDSHRVSVAPLRYGAGMKGKVGEALAAGLPVVATPVASEGMGLADGEETLLEADDAAAFARAVVRVCTDDVLWRRLSAAGRAHVAGAYDVPVVAAAVGELVAAAERRRPEVSIVIPLHGQLACTRECLESIEAHTPESHELILVDNGSTDGTAEFLRGYAHERPHVTVVLNEENRGFAAGNNLGLALARGRAVLLLNNDTIVTPGWLGRMLAVLERRPEVGLVGPVSNYVSGLQQVPEAVYETRTELEAFAERWAAEHDGDSEEVARLVGFCLLARREVVERVGGLDERFGSGNFEDDDWCVRAQLAGARLRIARDSFIHHSGSRTFRGAGIDYRGSLERNWTIFRDKWGREGVGFVPDGLPAGVRLHEPLPAVGETHAPSADGRWWEERAGEGSLIAARRAITSGSVEQLRAVFARLATVDDPQRVYQRRRQITELVLASSPALPVAVWTRQYAEAAAVLLDALEQDGPEPVLANYAGVLLYELFEHRAAEALFRAAARLDPSLPNVAANRRAARARRRAPGPDRLLAALEHRLHALGARATRVAGTLRPAEGQTLSVVMIVKDEEEMLPGCLEPLAGAVDEIVVVDTGSTDRTRELAESFGAKVVDFPWNGSFADARNASLDAATGDWVMYVDADEHLVAEDAPRLRELLGRTWREAFYVLETNYTGGDDSGAAVTHAALRIWRNRPGYRFEGRIHEQITPSMPTYLPERFETSQVRLLHYGYLKSRIQERDKSRRNLELLEREAQESPTPFTWFNLGSEHLMLSDAAKARDYLDRAWKELRTEEGWSARGYAPLLTRRTIAARRESGALDAARRAVAEGLAAYPRHTDLVFELALVERAAGDTDAAVAAAERCLAQGDSEAHLSGTVGSGSFLALCLLAELHQDRGDLAAAEAFYRRSLEEHPSYAGPVLPLAVLMLRRGAAPADVEALVPARPGAALLAASAFYEAGHAEVAERWFRRVLDRQPSNPVARIGLVESLLAQARFEAAAAEAALEPDESPVAPLARSAELLAYAVLGDVERLDGALANGNLSAGQRGLYSAWRAVLAGEPPAAVLAADCLGDAVRSLELLLRVQAFQEFETLVGLFERIAVAARERRELLARVYFRRGFLDSAADEWIEVAERAPDAAALIGLAQVAHARGLPDDARLLADEAARLEPANDVARRLVAGLAARAA